MAHLDNLFLLVCMEDVTKVQTHSLTLLMLVAALQESTTVCTSVTTGGQCSDGSATCSGNTHLLNTGSGKILSLIWNYKYSSCNGLEKYNSSAILLSEPSLHFLVFFRIAFINNY